jgi:predicted esterase
MLLTCDQIPGPHAGQPVVLAGRRPQEAAAAVVLIHGRGGNAEGMLSLASELDWPQFSYLAPQAVDNTWYPFSFLAPVEDNEPWLSSALAVVECTLEHAQEAGIPPHRTVLLGFSQGACLALEFVARRPRRLGGVVAWSGALIQARPAEGALDGTPVFLGCSDRDPHVPLDRFQDTAVAMRTGGGDVTERVYPGMGHTVNPEEIAALRALMGEVLDPVRSTSPQS